MENNNFHLIKSLVMPSPREKLRNSEFNRQRIPAKWSAVLVFTVIWGLPNKPFVDAEEKANAGKATAKEFRTMRPEPRCPHVVGVVEQNSALIVDSEPNVLGAIEDPAHGTVREGFSSEQASHSSVSADLAHPQGLGLDGRDSSQELATRAFESVDLYGAQFAAVNLRSQLLALEDRMEVLRQNACACPKKLGPACVACDRWCRPIRGIRLEHREYWLTRIRKLKGKRRLEISKWGRRAAYTREIEERIQFLKAEIAGGRKENPLAGYALQVQFTQEMINLSILADSTSLGAAVAIISQTGFYSQALPELAKLWLVQYTAACVCPVGSVLPCVQCQIVCLPVKGVALNPARSWKAGGGRAAEKLFSIPRFGWRKAYSFALRARIDHLRKVSRPQANPQSAKKSEMETNCVRRRSTRKQIADGLEAAGAVEAADGAKSGHADLDECASSAVGHHICNNPPPWALRGTKCFACAVGRVHVNEVVGFKPEELEAACLTNPNTLLMTARCAGWRCYWFANNRLEHVSTFSRKNGTLAGAYALVHAQIANFQSHEIGDGGMQGTWDSFRLSKLFQFHKCAWPGGEVALPSGFENATKAISHALARCVPGDNPTPHVSQNPASS